MKAVFVDSPSVTEKDTMDVWCNGQKMETTVRNVRQIQYIWSNLQLTQENLIIASLVWPSVLRESLWMMAQRHALVWGNMSVASRRWAQARKRTQLITFYCWMERKYQLQHNKSAKFLSTPSCQICVYLCSFLEKEECTCGLLLFFCETINIWNWLSILFRFCEARMKKIGGITWFVRSHCCAALAQKWPASWLLRQLTLLTI